MSAGPTTSEGIVPTLFIQNEYGNKITFSLAIPDLKRNKSCLARLFQFRKPKNPLKLASNARFGEYSLTNHSLTVVIDVYKNKRALKDRSEPAKRYVCRIAQFPCEINSHSVKCDFEEAENGDGYLIFNCIKIGNCNTSWKEYLMEHPNLCSAS